MKKFWMVIRAGSAAVTAGRVVGSNAPTRIINNIVDAEAELERLAIKHPEISFTLLEAVKKVEAKVSYELFTKNL